MSRAKPTASEDRRWMEQALALAALGEGATSPNPRVGCVLVRDGQAVGGGFHRAYGAAHAEADAVAAAGSRARGATAYVNLEPCAHHGQTPPCAELLASAGVRRVVAALRDPNPIVDGRGIALLEAAGIEVEVGLLSEAAEAVNDSFLHRHRHGRPLVTVKAATSLDGLLSAREGRSRWITEAPARRFAHRLRLRHDAVLVGAGTVRADDPRLTVRLPGVDAVRRRVVLAPSLDLDPTAALFDGVPGAPLPRIYAGPESSDERARRFEGRAEVIRVPSLGDGLDLTAVLLDLLTLDVQSLLVEGGARTIGSFLAASLVDRLALFHSDRLLGARGATPLVDLPSVVDPSHGWRLVAPQQLALGRDRLLLGRLDGPERG